MREEARNSIDSHRLMRVEPDQPHIVHVDDKRETHAAHVLEARRKLIRRSWIHVGIFVVSFIFTAGAVLLSVVLWVQPGAIAALVITGIFSALIFVATFAELRMLILHTLLNEYPNAEEDPGKAHHRAKSIAYGFVALVFAFVLVGLITL